MAKENSEEKTTNRKKSTGTSRRKSSSKSSGSTRRKSSASGKGSTRRKSSAAGTGSRKRTGELKRRSTAKRTRQVKPKKQDLDQQELLFDENGNIIEQKAADETQYQNVVETPVEVETPTVEAPVEEIPVEETPAKETPDEETPVEETPAEAEEDASPAAEEVVEETVAEVEEVTDEADVAEAPAEAETSYEAETPDEDEYDDAEDEDIPKTTVAAPFNTAKVFGIVFAAVLIITFVLNIVIKDKLYSDQENRVFQQFPDFSVGNYLSGRFESQLDNYVNDQFMFRDTFIKIKSASDLTIGKLKANNVFKCRDNYLMEDITYPDQSGFKADVEALKQFKKKYSGKKMYFMLVPNAANILKSKLPGGVVTHDQNRDMDKLFGAVEALGYTTIDVRDELKKASRNTQIYYRTDHHWTTDGAYIAYKKAHDVMKLRSDIKYKSYAVKNDFIGTLYSKSGFTNGKNDAIKIYLPDDKRALNSVIRYADTKEKTTNYYDMENLDKKDAYTVFGGTNHSLFSITTPTRTKRNLLVIKDSYANCFIPFLTQDYRSITVVDPRYYYENIATVIKANEINDVLFLYNSNTFFQDNYMRMMLTNR